MAIFKLKDSDVIRNVIKLHPKQDITIYDGNSYYSEKFPTTTLPIYSFITKDGSRSSFKTVTTDEYNSDFTYGDIITGSSISFFSASLSRYFYDEDEDRPYISGTMRNTFDFYSVVSPHFKYSSSYGNKETQAINIISVPSLLYGSSIKKGTVDLSFYVSGSLVGRLRDEKHNGELVQVEPVGSVGSGSIAGVCFYKEGILSLTGSWSMGTGKADYQNQGGDYDHKWIYYGAGIEQSFGSGIIPHAAFQMSFEGVQKTSTVTIMCNAPKGLLNYSNNPTYVEAGGNQYITSSDYYTEVDSNIYNTTFSPYSSPTGSFQKTTYISKVYLYDEDMNVVAVAKMATPIKKVEDREFTIKLKVDI